MSLCHNSFHSQQYPGNQQINSTIGNKKFRYKYDDFKKKGIYRCLMTRRKLNIAIISLKDIGSCDQMSLSLFKLFFFKCTYID